jgi:acyl-CoA thioesterase-2
MMTPIDELLSILDLERIEVDRFRGHTPETRSQRIYGGQVLAQALIAAGRTVDDWVAHSMHAYFLRPGDPATPILFEVDRIRDGRSFATRRVVAIQNGRAIFNMSASYQKVEKGLEHQIAPPDVPGAESLQSELELNRDLLPRIPEAERHWFTDERALELRAVDPVDLFEPEKRPPVQQVWLRTTGAVPEDLALNQSLLAYASDWTLLDTSVLPHGLNFMNANLQVASLDHSMWFHRPFRCDEWLLYVQDSPCASGGRALCRGSLYDEGGQLVASVSQEGLIRQSSAESA